MKVKVYLVALLLSIGGAAQAQLNLGSLEKEATTAVEGNGLSSLLTTFGSSINPNSLTSGFQSQASTWLQNAKAVKTPAEAATLLTQLSNGFKTSAFKKGWDAIKPKFLTQSKSVTTTSQLASLGTTLNSNLAPSTFNTAGAQGEIAKLLGDLK